MFLVRSPTSAEIFQETDPSSREYSLPKCSYIRLSVKVIVLPSIESIVIFSASNGSKPVGAMMISAPADQ